jgi:hypothetical protein
MSVKRVLFPALAFGVLFFSLTAESCATSGGAPAGASASGVATVAKGQPMIYSSGEQVTVTAYAAGVTDPNALETAAPGQQCVKVSVAIKNGSTSEWSLPLSEMTIVDASGQKYNADNGIGTCPSGTASISSLVAGGSGTADLVFQVPTSGKLDFNWTPVLATQVFQVPLG